MSEQTREELIMRLRRAFRNAPHPGDAYITLGCEPSVDFDARYGEEADVAKAFSGLRWTEVDIPTLHEAGQFPFCFMTAPAFRYFFPGVILCALEMDDLEPLHWTGLIHELAPARRKEQKWINRFASRTEGFDDDCTRVIRDCLCYFRQVSDELDHSGELDRAIDYWSSMIEREED